MTVSLLTMVQGVSKNFPYFGTRDISLSPKDHSYIFAKYRHTILLNKYIKVSYIDRTTIVQGVSKNVPLLGTWEFGHFVLGNTTESRTYPAKNKNNLFWPKRLPNWNEHLSVTKHNPESPSGWIRLQLYLLFLVWLPMLDVKLFWKALEEIISSSRPAKRSNPKKYEYLGCISQPD